MAALLGLDANLRPIGRPQTLEEMQNVPILFPVIRPGTAWPQRNLGELYATKHS